MGSGPRAVLDRTGARGTKGVTILPRVDGTDPLSLKALGLLEQGEPLGVIETLGLTRDQVKKLSRLRSLVAAAELHLPAGAAAKLRGLGLRALALVPMAQGSDWAGLSEALESIDPALVKREDLERVPQLLAEKRARIAEVEAEIEGRCIALEYTRQQLQAKQAELMHLQAEIEKNLQFLQSYPAGVQDFLAEHLGVDKEGRLCLARRLDYPWQSGLKRKEVLQYAEDSMVWLVKDLDYLAKAVERRLENGQPVRYDPNRVPRTPFRQGPIPTSARYRMITGLAVDLREARNEQRRRLSELRREMEEAEQEIREIRRRSPQSFLEAVLAADQLSGKDLKTHGRLQAAALRWLFDQGCVAAAELVQGTRRWDVAGYDQAGAVTIIEAKASLHDFRRDVKWRECLDRCDRFFFVVEESLVHPEYGTRELADTGAGVLGVDRGGRVTVHQECRLQVQARDRIETQWAVARAVSRRVAFGF